MYVYTQAELVKIVVNAIFLFDSYDIAIFLSLYFVLNQKLNNFQDLLNLWGDSRASLALLVYSVQCIVYSVYCIVYSV